jgi:hypothetical protein
MAITPIEALSLDEQDLELIQTMEGHIDRTLRSSFKNSANQSAIYFYYSTLGSQYKNGVNALVREEIIALYQEKGWKVTHYDQYLIFQEAKAGQALKEFLSRRQRERVQAPALTMTKGETPAKDVTIKRAMELE